MTAKSVFFLAIGIISQVQAQMGINNSSPDASSVLDMTSTSAGVLVPRMTEAQRDAVSSAATGLLIYQTNNTKGFYYYDGAKWRTIASNDRTVTTITSTTTLDTGHDIVLVNNSSVIDIDLPTAVNNSGKTYYIKKVSSNTTRARIDPNGSQTIDGLDSLELFIENDAVRIVSDNSNWKVISDELKVHTAAMTRDAAQSISNNTVTKVALDNEDYDVGGIADVATNDRFDIRRAGKYLITADWTASSLDDGETMIVRIYKNGVNTREGYVTSATSNATPTMGVTALLDLAVDDYIEMYIYHNEGAAMNTFTVVASKPIISIMEIRN